MSLNPKQQRFVEEYLVDLNGTQAAIRAGYSPKTAEVQASRLLSNAKVQQAVAEGRARLSQSTGITRKYPSAMPGDQGVRAKNRRLEVLAKVCRATLRGLKPKVWLMGEPKRVYVELGELDQIRVVLEMIDVEESS